MRLLPIRRFAVAAIAAICLLACTPQALAARGGLSITPGIFEAVALPGALGTVEIANTTSRPMKVGFAARPWRQAENGSVTPDRRRVLGRVRPNRKSFWLHAGATRAVNVSLTDRPAAGSLYGAIEATGAPKYGGTKGIKVAYRLVTSMRLFPPVRARRYTPRPRRLFEHGSVRHGGLFLAVENGGNTIDPIGGRVEITGRGHSLSAVVTPKTILPGATVNLLLAHLRGTLPRGRYNVVVHLTQVGRKVGTVKRRGVRLR